MESGVSVWRLPHQFKRELSKLGLDRVEAATVSKVMDRFREGKTQPKDHKVLRDGVEELRIRGNRRIIRLYFGRIDNNLVLLCLHIHIKKKNNDKDAVDLAVDRLRGYVAGTWGADSDSSAPGG